MTNDRTLLTLAAKAAGFREFTQINGRYAVRLRNTGLQDWSPWNPLTDDGDALRLAVQCGIEISIVDDEPGTDGRSSRACAGYATENDVKVRYVFEDHRRDLFAATRRAIVRAAAAIGGSM